MAHAFHRELDLSGARRVIAAGDVHGYPSLLNRALDEIGYDAAAGDRLIIEGDLLDRGPAVIEVRDWLYANPNVITLMGNHDHMLAATVGICSTTEYANPYTLFRNGGQWLAEFAPGYEDDPGGLMSDLIGLRDDAAARRALIDPEVVDLARRIGTAPVALTVKTPGGRRIGLVHADVPDRDWTVLVAGLESKDRRIAAQTVQDAIWERHIFDRAKRALNFGEPDPADFAVSGIDHVFMGHSITREPMTIANCTFIDTGSYKHGIVTAVDVDAWLEKAA